MAGVEKSYSFIAPAKEIDVELTVKRSRFIGSVRISLDPDEASEKIKGFPEIFPKANHHCWAYRIGTENILEHCSDAGEPAGTAGRPILGMLKRHSLQNTLLVVTRYFGGIKLGAGGLVRAYTGSVSKAVQSCGLARKILMGTFALSADAADAGKLLNIIYQQQLFTVASVEYGQQARILLYMKQEQQDEAERWLTEALNTATQLEQVGSEYVEVPAEREK